MLHTQSVGSIIGPKTENRELLIDTNVNMYSIKDDLTSNWIYFAFKAFEKISTSGSYTSFATVGTGNGLDALGASIIFSDLEKLYLSDLDAEALNLSYQNVYRNLLDHQRKKIQLKIFCGSLMKPYPDEKIDIIYANLPNIPSDLDLSEGMLSASFYAHKNIFKFTDSNSSLIKELQSYLLELAYAFLYQARHYLSQRGKVLLNLGGRVPGDLVQSMFESLGYQFNEVLCGFKFQTEADLVIPGYAKYENQAVTFDFYLYHEAVEVLKKNSIPNPSFELDSKDFKKILEPFRLTAHEALVEIGKQNPVGHICYVIEGSRKNS